MTDTLMSAQLLSENHQLNNGKDRFNKQQLRIENDVGFGSRDDAGKLIKGCLTQVSQVIIKQLQVNEEKYDTNARYYLSLLDPDLLALIALNECFNSIHKHSSLNGIVVRMGKAVENEVWAKALEEEDKKLFVRLVLRATKTHGDVRRRRKAIRATAAKEGFSPVAWENNTRALIGGFLLSAVLEGCGEIFETYIAHPSADLKTTSRNLGLTDAGSDLLLNINAAQAWMNPMFLPMLVEPKPWTSTNTGAYYTKGLSSRVQLVRTFDEDHIKLINAAIADGTMAPCLEALNTIQNTAWAINKPLLDLVEWVWVNNIPIPDFPANKHIPKPTLPDDWNTLDENRRKGWRIQASQVALRNRGIDGDRVTVLQDLAVAKSLSGAERFYLPHSLDFRGRVYPVPSFNGQRADHIRSLFQFATGLPLGDSGAYWLAIHLANCGDFGGVSKRSLEERFTWTIDNEELIRKIATDPYSTVETWALADKPFQFVAACIEYKGFLEDGECFVSCLPIALDGSNSGLQHYAASLRSPEGALVNLVPSDLPADLYQKVADITVAEIQHDLTNSDEAIASLAKVVMENGVNRKLVKRNAMTFSYSSGEYGFKQQQMEDLMRPLGLKVLSGTLPVHPYGEDGGFKAAGYIAKKVYGAITNLVKDAVSGMKFFQHCAAALAHESKGLTWVTPVGLPVTHRYTEWDSKHVRLFLHDKYVPVIESSLDNADTLMVDSVDAVRQVQLTIRTRPSSRINKAKAKSAISPNVIHSLDASHLMLTVLKAKDNGLKDFSLIHDSFGTHAANTSEFFYMIREAFVDMYENYCPYETIYNATFNTIDDKSKVPNIPLKGALDVTDTYSSLYAFA
jgi:DNA-directed RNA polymerase